MFKTASLLDLLSNRAFAKASSFSTLSPHTSKEILKSANKMPFLYLLFPVFLSLISACANTPLYTNDIADTKSYIKKARAAGAAELAAVEFNRAVRKIEHAEKLFASGNLQEAQKLALEAQLDAQTAQAKAESVRSTSAFTEVHAETVTLRSQDPTIDSLP